VTGATGFVGARVCAALERAGRSVTAVVRDERAAARLPPVSRQVAVGDLAGEVDWRVAVADVDAVVHLAARVHVLDETGAEAADEYRRVNVDATVALAEAAAASGVQRFVFVSTIKVQGEGRAEPYTEADPAGPTDAYAHSKWLAEQRLADIGRRTGMEVCVLRPPLVYGRNVGGNFLRLLRLVDVAAALPLPLGGIRNCRSMLFVDNLADAVVACVRHPAAAGELFLVSDGEDLSTSELLSRLARIAGSRARLFPVPQGVVETGARLVGKAPEARRLLGTLTVDSSRIRRRLGWVPPFTVDEGLRATHAWYREAAR
jgi:nucleoside-diphosphate-sugar epimerase